MTRSGSRVPSIIRFLLILVLIILAANYYMRYSKLIDKLAGMRVFRVTNGTVMAVDGLGLEPGDSLLTVSALEVFHTYFSPFGDNKPYQQLLDRYVRVKSQDLYGAPRRTGAWRRIHEGIDLFVPENTPLYPIADFGIVTEVSDNEHHKIAVPGTSNGRKSTVEVEYGRIVRVLYPEGIESLYAHLADVKVKTGDVVNRSTLLGHSGVSGNLVSSGKPSHLHLELRDSAGKSFDPLSRLMFNKADYRYFLGTIKIEPPK